MRAAIILCLVACLSVSLNAKLALTKADSWDFLVLAQFWPGSSCIYFRKQGCHVPPGEDRWTIHGFWPSSYGSQQPEFCNNTMKFNYTKIQSLEAQLNKYWPYYDDQGQRSVLWAHEWEKHGTCAYVLPEIRGELKYFNTTMQVYSQLNTYEVLGKAGILPSSDKQYNLNDVFSAVAKAYKKLPQIECYKADGKNYLDQLYLCYDKSLQPIDCPSVHMSTSWNRPGHQQMSKQSLLFKSESIGKDVGEQADKTGQYFVECPTDNLVYYIPKPQDQVEIESTVNIFEHINES